MDIMEMLGGLPPTRRGAGGRKPQVPVDWHIVRGLEPEEEAMIVQVKPSEAPQTSVVTALRASHHALARCLAEGHGEQVASAITGYSPAWISTLKGDPAFGQLVKYYTDQKEAVFVDVAVRMRTLGLSTLDELQQRLEVDPAGWTKEELMDLATLTLGKGGGQGQSAAPAAASNVQITFVTADPLPEPKAVTIDSTGEELPR